MHTYYILCIHIYILYTFDILLYNLQYYGVNRVPLLLIKGYLNVRCQYTKYYNLDYMLLVIKTGILRGSILGPLYFSI